MRRICGRGLSSGTVAERIAPESVTRLLSGFVHRNISRWRSGCGTRSSLAGLHKRPIGGAFLKSSAHGESNQNWQRVKPRVGSIYPLPLWERVAKSSAARLSRVRGLSPRIETPHPARTAHSRCKASASFSNNGGRRPPMATFSHKGKRRPGGPHCVLATRGGVAWVMTRIRVPATGTNAISMLRWAARYLITGRSGM